MTDEIGLVRCAQKGDRDAFESLYRTYVSRVYTLALRMSGNSHTAEDLTQEVFIRLWEKIGSFEERSSFSTWLYRLALNHLMNRTKKSVPVSRIPEEYPDGNGGPGREDLFDLRRAILTLPPRSRAVLILHELMNHTHREIGEVMGTSESTCKAQLFKARKKLKKELER